MASNDPAKKARQALTQVEIVRQRAVIQEFETIQLRLAADLDVVLRQIEQERQTTGNASPAAMFQQFRLNELINQVADSIREASLHLATLTSTAQTAAIDVAEAQARQTPELQASLVHFDEAATRELVGLAGDGQPLSTYFAALAAPARDALFDALFFGIASGNPNAQIAKEVKDALNGTTARAMTIVRTEMNRSYRESTRKFYETVDDVVGWRWLSARDLRTCPLCWAMDGRIFKTKTKFGTHPNCLMPDTMVSTPGVKAVTGRWYSGEVLTIETGKGRRLTVTINHPILTGRGWIAAQFVDKSDDIFSGGDCEGMSRRLYPNDYNRPTAAKEIFNAFTKSSGMSSTVMPTTAEYFHGDGTGGDIQVIRPDGFLSDDVDFESLQICEQCSLRFGNAGLRKFATLGPLFEIGKASFAAAHGVMSVGGISTMFGRSPLTHHKPISFDLAADFDAGADQVTTESLPVNAETVFETLSRLTGCVSRDRVVNVFKRHYSGYVYNLESETGFYSANEIIVSNCRCTMVPVFQGEKKQVTGAAAFAKLNEAQKLAILGPGRLALYNQGAELIDFVELNKSAFGIGRNVKPLSRTTFKPNPRTIVPVNPAGPATPKKTSPDRLTPKPASPTDFSQSKVVNPDGSLKEMFHGSAVKIEKFDLSKVRTADLDAPFNGFWFTDNVRHASPALQDPKFVHKVHLNITNPISRKGVNALLKAEPDLRKLSGSEMRTELERRGFDGVEWQVRPEVDAETFKRKGTVDFITPAGGTRRLIADRGGVDLYQVYPEGGTSFITGYDSLADFLETEYDEEIFVAFRAEQIRLLSVTAKK